MIVSILMMITNWLHTSLLGVLTFIMYITAIVKTWNIQYKDFHVVCENKGWFCCDKIYCYNNVDNIVFVMTWWWKLL
jgi:hypothetical protein